MKNLLFLLCVIGFNISCVSDQIRLHGKWQISSYNREYYTFPISNITFQDSIAQVVDQYGVLYTFDVRLKKNKLFLTSNFDSLQYDMQIHDDSLRIDDILFVPHGSENTKDDIEINLLNLSGKPLILESDRYFDFFVCLDKEHGSSILRLNDKITDFRDLPIFLERGHSFHNTKRKRIILAVDKEVLYTDLLETYYWLCNSNAHRVFLVTKANGLGIYEGIEDAVEFWEEDFVNYFKKKESILSGIPSSKEKFFESTENLTVIEDMDIDKLDEFKELFKKRKSTILLNINKQISLEEYAKTMIDIKNHVSKVKEEESIEKYGFPYDDLKIEQKKEFWNTFTRYLIRR